MGYPHPRALCHRFELVSSCNSRDKLGKFCWVAGRLATKQTFRLANRELDRVGGASGLACKAAEGACWTATHPVEATAAGVGIANEAGKAAYGQALWMVDLLATVRDEMSS